ncbi:hypothetical protein BGZ98_006742 [Dissophora globulifera]|nr:hypothetical protein BGZ98_006742 [Dissophora globulifera]
MENAGRTASGSHLHPSVNTQHTSNSVGSSINNGNRDTDDSRINYNSSSATSQQGTEHREGDRSRLKMLFQKLSVAYRGGQPLADASSKGPTYLTRIEKVPIIWDNDNQQPETRPIPGLGKPNSPKLKFPPELTKTIIRLANEPPPMTNYLAYVTHTDVRSWSAASNMTLVHEILGDARPSWRTRLQSFMMKTSRKLISSQSLSDRQASATAATEFMYDNRQDLDDFDEDDGEVFDLSLTFRNTSRYRRWRRRVKRNKNLWELRDVDFLELLLLFYTSAKMGSLSLGMNCSHWYHPSLNVLLPGIPERLSSLRRIVIDHADTIVHNAVPVPQLFIQRHQKAFPGKLREIQIRQSYHYSYDMSKSVLQTIKAMERLEVLDLSIWTGVFSGLDSICTDHLRKLLICHHMDVTRPEMFDELLKRCPVLEELSIVVPHSNLFAWALKRRVDLVAQVAGAGSGAGAGEEVTATKPSSKSFPLSRGATEDRQPAHLPPLKNLTLFGHTPDVVSAFKDAVFAFQHTLESVQVSMYSDMGQPPDSHSHFEVSPPHFELPDEMPQASFFGTNSLQDTLQMNASPSNPVPVGPQSTFDPYNVSPELSALWHQEILTGINTNDDGSPGLGLSSASSCKSPPSYLTWSWPLPRLRTMTLRGPVVAFFDLRLLRFCPQLRDVALSYHCACLPRLVFPTTVLAGDGGAATSVPNRYPRIMVCDSLALEWGMTLQEERRGMVMV